VAQLLFNNQFCQDHAEIVQKPVASYMDACAIQELSECSFESRWLYFILFQAVLKRVLRVSHPMLQLHVLKLIKSQVPFCGRKWRQCTCDDFSHRHQHLPVLANMKVITSIYLNCRPDLRDEWLTGTEVDDISDAQVRMSLINCVSYANVLTGTRTSAAPPR
jgi:hypothetical protein